MRSLALALASWLMGVLGNQIASMYDFRLGIAAGLGAAIIGYGFLVTAEPIRLYVWAGVGRRRPMLVALVFALVTGTVAFGVALWLIQHSKTLAEQQASQQVPPTHTYPAVDFELVPEDVSPMAVVSHVPALMLSVKNRGGAAIENVRLRVTEYLFEYVTVVAPTVEKLPDDKIRIHPGKHELRIKEFVKAADDSLVIESVAAKATSPQYNLSAMKPFRFVTPPAAPNLQFNYALRFAFVDSSTQKRYAHYRIIYPGVPYLMPYDQPHTSVSVGGKLRLGGGGNPVSIIGEDFFTVQSQTIMAHQRMIYASHPEEEYR